jgi:hypothetical protein
LAQASLQAAQMLGQEMRQVGLYLRDPWGRNTPRR